MTARKQVVSAGFPTPSAKAVVEEMDAVISNHIATYEWSAWKEVMAPFWADGFVYDEIHVGTEPFKLPAGREKLRDALVARFPQEEAAILKYLEACVVANKAADIWFFSNVN